MDIRKVTRFNRTTHEQRQIILLLFWGSLCFLIGKSSVVKAAAQISSIADVELGMSIAEVLPALKGSYSIQSIETVENMRHYTITSDKEHRYYYEIVALNGKVASIWTNDAKTYFGGCFYGQLRIVRCTLRRRSTQT